MKVAILDAHDGGPGGGSSGAVAHRCILPAALQEKDTVERFAGAAFVPFKLI